MRKLRFDISSTRGPDHYETRSLARRLVALKRDSEVYKALRYEGDGVRFLLLGPLVDERDCKYWNNFVSRQRWLHSLPWGPSYMLWFEECNSIEWKDWLHTSFWWGYMLLQSKLHWRILCVSKRIACCSTVRSWYIEWGGETKQETYVKTAIKRNVIHNISYLLLLNV